MTRASIASRPFDAAGIAGAAAIAGGPERRFGRRFSWFGAPAARPFVLFLVLALVVLTAAVVAIGAGLLREPVRLTGTVDPAGRMASPRIFSADALMADGRVLFAGGTFADGDPDPVVAEVYDPSTGSFSTTGAMVQRRESCKCGGPR